MGYFGPFRLNIWFINSFALKTISNYYAFSTCFDLIVLLIVGQPELFYLKFETSINYLYSTFFKYSSSHNGMTPCFNESKNDLSIYSGLNSDIVQMSTPFSSTWVNFIIERERRKNLENREFDCFLYFARRVQSLKNSFELTPIQNDRISIENLWFHARQLIVPC